MTPLLLALSSIARAEDVSDPLASCLAGDRAACVAVAVAAEREWAWSAVEALEGRGGGSRWTFAHARAARARACALGDAASCRPCGDEDPTALRDACRLGDAGSCDRLDAASRFALCAAGSPEHAACAGARIVGRYPEDWARPTVLSWGVVDASGLWTDGGGTVTPLLGDAAFFRQPRRPGLDLYAIPGDELAVVGVGGTTARVGAAEPALGPAPPRPPGPAVGQVARSPSGAWTLARQGPWVTAVDAAGAERWRVRSTSTSAAVSDQGVAALDGWIVAPAGVDWAPRGWDSAGVLAALPPVPVDFVAVDGLGGAPIRGVPYALRDRSGEVVGRGRTDAHGHGTSDATVGDWPAFVELSRGGVETLALPWGEIPLAEAGVVGSLRGRDRAGARWQVDLEDGGRLVSVPLPGRSELVVGTGQWWVELADGRRVRPAQGRLEPGSAEAPWTVVAKSCSGEPLPGVVLGFGREARSTGDDGRASTPAGWSAGYTVGGTGAGAAVREDPETRTITVVRPCQIELRVETDADRAAWRAVFPDPPEVPVADDDGLVTGALGTRAELLADPVAIAVRRVGGEGAVWVEVSGTVTADGLAPLAVAPMATKQVAVVDARGRGLGGIPVRDRGTEGRSVVTGLDGTATIPAAWDFPDRVVLPRDEDALRQSPERGGDAVVSLLVPGPGPAAPRLSKYLQDELGRIGVPYHLEPVPAGADPAELRLRYEGLPVLAVHQSGEIEAMTPRTSRCGGLAPCGIGLPARDPPGSWPDAVEPAGRWQTTAETVASRLVAQRVTLPKDPARRWAALQAMSPVARALALGTLGVPRDLRPDPVDPAVVAASCPVAVDADTAVIHAGGGDVVVTRVP